MGQIALAADFHFGVGDRLDDCLWAARVVREHCRAVGIDVVVVLGDLFHDRRSLGIDVITRVCEFFERTADEYGQRWIAFPGNHDMFLRYSWRINSLAFMKRYLTTICDVKQLILDDRRFWIIPFIAFESAYMKVLEEVSARADPADVLLTHVGIRGASLNTCFLLRDWSVVDFTGNRFAKVYAGHFHSYQKVHHNVWYVGSPIPFKHDEGDVPHGFITFDLKTAEHRLIDVWKAGTRYFPDEPQPPQFRTITDEQVDDAAADAVRGAAVRLCLTRERADADREALRERLLAMGARSVKVVNWEEKLSGGSPDRVRALVERGLVHQDPFRAWVDADRDLKAYDRNLLLACNYEVVKEGDELYSAQADDLD